MNNMYERNYSRNVDMNNHDTPKHANHNRKMKGKRTTRTTDDDDDCPVPSFNQKWQSPIRRRSPHKQQNSHDDGFHKREQDNVAPVATRNSRSSCSSGNCGDVSSFALGSSSSSSSYHSDETSEKMNQYYSNLFKHNKDTEQQPYNNNTHSHRFHSNNSSKLNKKMTTQDEKATTAALSSSLSPRVVTGAENDDSIEVSALAATAALGSQSSASPVYYSSLMQADHHHHYDAQQQQQTILSAFPGSCGSLPTSTTQLSKSTRTIERLLPSIDCTRSYDEEKVYEDGTELPERTSRTMRYLTTSESMTLNESMILPNFPSLPSNITGDFADNATVGTMDGGGHTRTRPSISLTTRRLLERAYDAIQPTQLFKLVLNQYAERSTLVIVMMHLVSTLIVCAHYFLIRYQQKLSNVPVGASHYHWRTVLPPILFGIKHGILLQLAILPLTMCRFTLSFLSSTWVRCYLPLNRVVHFHIFLGYVFTALITLLSVGFMAFYGTLCYYVVDDDEAAASCSQLYSIIMMTGHALTACIVLIAITSYFRNTTTSSSSWKSKINMSYELFTGVHTLAFLFYALIIAHTIDRPGAFNTRTQTVQWVSLSLLYYMCDKCAMHFFQTFRVRILSATSISSSAVSNTTTTSAAAASHSTHININTTAHVLVPEPSGLLLVRLYRPPLFVFCPGQYAYLKVPMIDATWHPFSIASDPASDVLEFYVHVTGRSGSWTDRFFKLVQQGQFSDHNHTTTTDVWVQGPCGTSFAARINEYSQALLISSGIGVVPAISFFKQQVRQFCRIHPKAHLDDQRKRKRRIYDIQQAKGPQKGSLLNKLMRHCFQPKQPYSALQYKSRTETLRESIESSVWSREKIAKATTTSNSGGNGLPTSPLSLCSPTAAAAAANVAIQQEQKEALRDMKRAALETTRSIYGVVILGALPVWGVALIGTAFSWNTLTDTAVLPLPNLLFTIHHALSVLFQFIFFLLAVGIWDANTFFLYTDVAICLLAPFGSWYWFFRNNNNEEEDSSSSSERLSIPDLTLYCLLTGYMTLRAWSVVVQPRSGTWRSLRTYGDPASLSSLERLEVVWICPSATLVTEITPLINSVWQELVDAWGLEHSALVCRFNIYVTDKDPVALRTMELELAQTILYRHGFIRLGRPNLSSIIESYSIDLIRSIRTSHTLLAYVGSPQLAERIHELKLYNDIKLAISGNKKHQIDFISEWHGSSSESQRRRKIRQQEQHAPSFRRRQHQKQQQKQQKQIVNSSSSNKRQKNSKLISSAGGGECHDITNITCNNNTSNENNRDAGSHPQHNNSNKKGIIEIEFVQTNDEAGDQASEEWQHVVLFEDDKSDVLPFSSSAIDQILRHTTRRPATSTTPITRITAMETNADSTKINEGTTTTTMDKDILRLKQQHFENAYYLQVDDGNQYYTVEATNSLEQLQPETFFDVLPTMDDPSIEGASI